MLCPACSVILYERVAFRMCLNGVMSMLLVWFSVSTPPSGRCSAHDVQGNKSLCYSVKDTNSCSQYGAIELTLSPFKSFARNAALLLQLVSLAMNSFMIFKKG